MTIKIFEITNIKTPGSFSGEIVERKIDLFKGRILSESDVFFYRFYAVVVDLIVRKIDIHDKLCNFKHSHQHLWTISNKIDTWLVLSGFWTD